MRSIVNYLLYLVSISARTLFLNDKENEEPLPTLYA